MFIFGNINIYKFREDEPIDTDFNWFDICFYTTTIEYVFGEKYKTWTEKPLTPPILDEFFISIIKKLFDIYKFQLAIIDFEVSGQYYLCDLHKALNAHTNSRFFVGSENAHIIANENKSKVYMIN